MCIKSFYDSQNSFKTNTLIYILVLKMIIFDTKI